KRQENLRAAGPIVALSRQLVRLATDVPLELTWEDWRLKPMDAPRLTTLFREWGFHSLANQVKGQAPAAAGPAQGEVFGDGADLFPFGANAPGDAEDGGAAEKAADRWEATYHLVDTEAKFAKFLKDLKKQRRIAFDLETTSLQPLEADIVGLAFAWKPG